MTTSTNDNMPPFYFPDPSVQSSIVHPTTGELWIFADGVWMIADPDDPEGSIPTPDDNSSNDSELLRAEIQSCLLYTSPSPRDMRRSRMPSSA